MRVTLAVNGAHRELDVEPHRSLAAVLRDHGRLGAPGCADGTCGGCEAVVDGEVIRSCLMLAVQCDGARVLVADEEAAA
ncbi:hypothetical protein GCM10010168_37810 [Actinoplanes ianthinogenes]|uniref:2Fe-2S ferredoxin-type domain-containing protein n=1 Tax=Actinoplanes ianthinogenes TaxID=122358 RepID=A0ABM7M4X8_9ACTN|nr:2Fe-2S iron-sulfur cluster-binding protein [Actinoplanes ianthinogenes]BCJ46697.1 hypothetical protein Aiant_73540 [Actinoplanes ianthinogenes]GGR16273.1 hypothetical protein GCM10010168_37810 [Actinoplanes ianthinogenes]